MGKILESLPNTIIAGVVLAIVVLLVAPTIAGKPGHELPSASEIGNKLKGE
ncbi:MAG: hypothetical protein Tsb008_07460 [Rhodothalassiaceae bacterium]